MRGFIKILCTVVLSAGVIVCMSDVAQAAYNTSGTSINLCYSLCGEYMGGACLKCDFSWSEGNYVSASNVSAYFGSNPEYNYNCMFHDIKMTNGTSNVSASAWCTYTASDTICFEYGSLDVSCDTYGVITDNGNCLSRWCEH